VQGVVIKGSSYLPRALIAKIFVMRQALKFTTTLLLLFVGKGYCQNLLSVDWQKVLGNNGYINQVYSICTDKDGNTYALGTFPNYAYCLGEYMNEKEGVYFLTKQNSKGDKIFARNFGGTDNFTSGDFKICSNGDIVLGICFKDSFKLNGDKLVESPGWNSIVIKIDQNFNVKWFKVFSSNGNTYITDLVVDDNDNIYTSIAFLNTLLVEGHTFHEESGYGVALLKLSSDGQISWVHHFFTDYNVTSRVLKFQRSCNTCPGILFMAGMLHADSLFIDDKFKLTKTSSRYDQMFISMLNEYGDIVQTKLLSDAIISVTDFDFYQNKTFIAGIIADTSGWNLPYSIYIGGLNDEGDLIGFSNLHNNCKPYLTGFHIDSKYGFVLSGSFEGNFSLQTSSISVQDEYVRSSFIATLDEKLNLAECKYMTGRSFNLGPISIHDNKISGLGICRGTGYFENDSCFSWNESGVVFQTGDITPLPSFNPHPFPEITTPFILQQYPNPFIEEFSMKFSEPVNFSSISMSNAIGQVCKDIAVTIINGNDVTINAKNLAAGFYIVRYTTCNNLKGSYKVIKADEY
jgi:hypothetical protein